MALEQTYPDDEKDSENGEASKLKRLASNGVDSCNGEPVSGDRTGADENGVTRGDVVELVVKVVTASVSNSLEDS
jgi:hypothetical protein